MQYSLILYSQEAEEAQVAPEEIERMMAAFDSYAKALEAAGVLVSADVLQPVAMTTTLTNHGGELRVQDGPFADTREKLNGTFVVEVPDLDTAIEWAAKCPGAGYGTMEIRPSAVVFRDGRWTQPE